MNISIVIPTYNRACLIQRAITSALSQMHKDDELIVVDDGSIDNTKKVLELFKDKINYIYFSRNTGSGFARNIGIKKAKGDLIAFLDSDDEWMEEKLDLQRALFNHYPDLFYAFSNMSITRNNGQIVTSYLYQWHRDKRSWDEILGKGEYYSSLIPLPEKINDFKVYIGDLYLSLARAPYIFSSTLVVRNQGAGEKWFFDEDIRIYEDWGCYGRIAAMGLGAYMDIDLSWQHDHKDNRLTSCMDTPVKYDARMKVLDRVWGQNQQFLQKHQTYYSNIVKTVQIISLIESIKEGKIKEARNIIKTVYYNKNLRLKLLILMPIFIVRIVHSVQLKLAKFRRRVSEN
ncbi:MAG: glycosyltransferase family 2 protein [Chitinispirillia bacterium]